MLVNPKVKNARLSKGTAFFSNSGREWDRVPNDDWDIRSVPNMILNTAVPRGQRNIDGSLCTVFEDVDSETWWAQLAGYHRWL